LVLVLRSHRFVAVQQLGAMRYCAKGEMKA
jgi:hypothetical protein